VSSPTLNEPKTKPNEPIAERGPLFGPGRAAPAKQAAMGLRYAPDIYHEKTAVGRLSGLSPGRTKGNILRRDVTAAPPSSCTRIHSGNGNGQIIGEIWIAAGEASDCSLKK